MKTEYNLFEKILVNTSKNYGYYNLLKKCYNRENIIKNVKNAGFKQSLLSFQELFGLSSPFSKLTSLWNCVNSIINELLKTHLIIFLNTNNVLEKFTDNLINYQKTNILAPKTVKNIEDFINNCIYFNTSPLNAICMAFSWRNSPETYSFWYRINILYRDYLYKLLFGKSYA